MDTNTLRKINISALVFVFIFGLSTLSRADQKALERVKNAKSAEGQVSAINKNGIAVVFGTDENGIENEIYLPFDKDTRLVHKRSIDQISVGDTVNVRFEDVAEEDESGIKMIRKAKVITFVRPAEKKPEIPEASEEEEGPLTLKGAK